ncbi:MAG: hypothetical protein ABII13_04745 [Patescibacteria group bacterium]|nr:hypothetical protein [Patescibacteria group bacterium]MBU2509485.1 hypothetical protein [Patescibacteria group bacterium]
MAKEDKNKNIKYGEISKAILTIVAGLGICSAVILLPGLVQAVPIFSTRKTHEKKKLLNKTLKRFERRGLIKAWTDGRGDEKVKLTTKGQEELIRYALRHTKIKRPKKWDKKWRVIIFDIPLEFNKTRDSLRSFLKKNDFVKLQRSVWVFPYPCEEVVELVRSALGARDETLYLTCSRFEGDKWMGRHFRLNNKH